MFDALKKSNILITASGLSPVGINTVLSVKKEVNKIVGVDIDENNTAKYFCDKFYKVPLVCDKHYIDAIQGICKKENINLIFPLTVEESIKLLEHKSIFDRMAINLAVNNNLETVKICNDKWLTNQSLKRCQTKISKAYVPKDIEELISSVKKLGYPKKQVAFKPRRTHGSRGFRIVSEKFDDYDILLNHKPTQNIFISLKQLIAILDKKKDFPKIMVMDYLIGDDYSVYCFCDKGQSLIIIPMKRSGLLPGMSLGGEIIKNEKIISYTKNIIRCLALSGPINIQLKNTRKGPLLYEINTRISATTIMTMGAGLNFPLLTILLSMGYKDRVTAEIKKVKIKWGLELYRVQREIFCYNKNFFEL